MQLNGIARLMSQEMQKSWKEEYEEQNENKNKNEEEDEDEEEAV